MKGKILIVEPEFIVATDVRMILQKAGYAIAGIASSGPAALDILLDQGTELVLLDITLNGEMNGIQLAKRLNELNIPFIYISSSFEKQVQEQALATDPCGFIEKPFLQKDILKALSLAFTKRRPQFA